MAKDDEDETRNPNEDDESSEETSAEEAGAEETSESEATGEETSEAATAEGTEDEGAAGSLGATRYVHAAFFAAAIIGAYIAGKLLGLTWGAIAEWPAAVRAVPQLVAYGEEQREGICLGAGAALGTLVVIQSYRKPSVRAWADDVAGELSRVTWPSRETVMNGTIVVVLASAIATVYVTILDRFWSFVTTLVYGA
jgi:preprotein translocase subunit SecE